MNSRVHPRYKTKYRATNWAECDRSRGERDDITLWISPEAFKAWKPRASRRRGAPRNDSDLAVETALTLRVVFQLPLRQAKGFLRSLLELMDISLEAPDHTTLSRRSKDRRVDLGPPLRRYDRRPHCDSKSPCIASGVRGHDRDRDPPHRHLRPPGEATGAAIGTPDAPSQAPTDLRLRPRICGTDLAQG